MYSTFTQHCRHLAVSAVEQLLDDPSCEVSAEDVVHGILCASVTARNYQIDPGVAEDAEEKFQLLLQLFTEHPRFGSQQLRDAIAAQLLWLLPTLTKPTVYYLAIHIFGIEPKPSSISQVCCKCRQISRNRAFAVISELRRLGVPRKSWRQPIQSENIRTLAETPGKLTKHDLKTDISPASFYQACVNGNLAVVQHYSKNVTDLTVVCSISEKTKELSSLEIAVRGGHLALVDWFLNAAPQRTQFDPFLQNALLWAIRGKSAEIADSIIARLKAIDNFEKLLQQPKVRQSIFETVSDATQMSYQRHPRRLVNAAKCDAEVVISRLQDTDADAKLCTVLLEEFHNTETASKGTRKRVTTKFVQFLSSEIVGQHEYLRLKADTTATDTLYTRLRSRLLQLSKPPMTTGLEILRRNQVSKESWSRYLDALASFAGDASLDASLVQELFKRIDSLSAQYTNTELRLRL